MPGVLPRPRPGAQAPPPPPAVRGLPTPRRMRHAGRPHRRARRRWSPPRPARPPPPAGSPAAPRSLWSFPTPRCPLRAERRSRLRFVPQEHRHVLTVRPTPREAHHGPANPFPPTWSTVTRVLDAKCNCCCRRQLDLRFSSPRNWDLKLPRLCKAPHRRGSSQERLELDRFWGPRLPASREGTRWLDILKVQVCYRLIDPGSDWRLHRHWYEHSALRDLLGCDRVMPAIRCIDVWTSWRAQAGVLFVLARTLDNGCSTRVSTSCSTI